MFPPALPQSHPYKNCNSGRWEKAPSWISEKAAFTSVREMTSEGRFLGTDLESTQKAVSLVQEQLGGQGGVLGGLLALACSIR